MACAHATRDVVVAVMVGVATRAEAHSEVLGARRSLGQRSSSASGEL